jgi:hypothetical protein
MVEVTFLKDSPPYLVARRTAFDVSHLFNFIGKALARSGAVNLMVSTIFLFVRLTCPLERRAE